MSSVVLMDVLRGLLLVALALTAVPVLYLFIVAVAAMLSRWLTRRRVPDASSPPSTRPQFAILVPACNEEDTLSRLLDSLAAQTYPKDRYMVCVVADNCTDRTAEIARTAGRVQVFERFDPVRRSKGYALCWLFEKLAEQGLVFDAYVVVDADSVVDPGFLKAMEESIARGAEALQGFHGVLNDDASPSAMMRWWAVSLARHVRCLGRDTMGFSASLTGNGMCFTRPFLQRQPWRAVGLVEDYEQYLMLVGEGERVRYVADAAVLSLTPETFAGLKMQDVRWESWPHGKTARRIAMQLLAGGLRERDPVRIDALFELMTPSLSIVGASTLLNLSAALLLRWPPAIILSLLLIAGLAVYGLSPFLILTPPRGVYRALLHVPGFMLWKLRLAVAMKRSAAPREWGSGRAADRR
ncbi:MAG TPA: glycosyltransferase family 2 protein [Candidatus Acidoferrales bacterium]|nr:glycosyltransferase family 2 protein [Candidatus Acidoferrales bacterium]